MEPFANKYRPTKIDEFIGQKHLVGRNSPISIFIKNKQIPSMVFWGPPGSGKTTLALIISKYLNADFIYTSAVSSGKEFLKKVLQKSKINKLYNKQTVFFLDEIHRWNKAQQDALLPYIERGDIILIGATTENPSFALNSALLSRLKVYIFNQHTDEDIKLRIKNILVFYKNVKIDESQLDFLSQLANGDMRSAINILEICINLLENKKNKVITKSLLENAAQKRLYYDKNGEEHYNTISALHKSMRSSNPTAACYWTMRMIEAGEDPKYIARRMVRFASEDIGLKDINALNLAINVYQTVEKLGLPECDVSLIQCAIYLANAPKDNTCYKVGMEARNDVNKYGNLPVPLHFRNPVTDLMKDVGYGKNYQYDHDLISKKSSQQCMPDALKDKDYFK